VQLFVLHETVVKADRTNSSKLRQEQKMKIVNSFNELLSNTTGGGSDLACFNDVVKIDETFQSLHRPWEILKGGLREVYETQKDLFWAKKNKDPREDLLAIRQRYDAVRPSIDNAVDELKSGVGRLNAEIQSEAASIAEGGLAAPKAHDRLVKKQRQIAESFLGNPALLEESAFRVVDVPSPAPAEIAKPERPRFATREEAEAYYRAQKK